MKTLHSFRMRVVVLVILLALFATPAYAESDTTDPVESVPADGWIVQLKSGSASLQSSAGLQSTFGDAEVEAVRGYDGAYLSRFTGDTSDSATIARLLEHPAVEFVEPNIFLEYQTEFTPNDIRFNQQLWADTINLPQAWGITGGKSDIVVAILDSGIRSDHPDLQGKIVEGRNYIDSSDDTSDYVGHGTHVAGIIGAIGNNEIGIAGTAMNVQLMPMRIGTIDGSPVHRLAQAIRDAVDDGADIINVSLGAESPSSLLESAVNYAYQNDVLFVAASGNQADKAFYPASYQQVIGVGATSLDGTRSATFTSRLTNTDLAAPGVNVLSTSWTENSGNTYLPDSGTSFAAPMVSGTAALVKSVNPDMSIEDIRTVLIATARAEFESDAPGTGAGLLDAYKALRYSIQHPFAATWLPADEPVASFESARSWLWGPNAFDMRLEPYQEAEHGIRAVVYYDKSRMEIIDFLADRSSEWFVTNGLLVNEMISGDVQTGDQVFETRQPADVPVAGDPDDPAGPLYSSFTDLTEAPPQQEDEIIVDTITRDGTVGENSNLADFDIRAVQFIPDTGHRIADVFWEYLNSTGTMRQNGAYLEGPIFEPTFFATGFPVTNAYWADVKVAGQQQDVLVQCFERRCLTYTPANEPGWRVEMGNVGQHYYRWRYQTEPMGQAIPDPTLYAMDNLR